MERYTDLDTVFERVWRRLSRAADDAGHPFRTLTFGTAQDGQPHLRTVVLREADAGERVLAFHTNRHSQKVADLGAGSRISWRGWDAEIREQVRLRGTATVHTDDAVAEAMWESQSPRSLAVYPHTEPPGTPLDGPDDGLKASVQDRPIRREDVEEGRPHFAVIRTVIDEIDWLHLHPEGHYRAQFELAPDQKRREGTWVVP
jgi:pyridoxine/pyridoxamine 5'-phosphate oxidase